jgi:nickel-dependent lactate racemase
VQVELGDFGVSVDLSDASVVASRRAPAALDVADFGAAVQAAMEQPQNFPPLRRALTPDDHIAVVIDEQLPQLGLMVGRVIEYLREAGINPTAITLVSAAGSRQKWVEDLPDSAQDVRTEIHDAADRKAVAYLASTRAGRRVYLNRTVVEADQTVILTGCRYDPALGIIDGAGALFPALSDAETQRSTAGVPSLAAGPETGLHAEATEIAWLLGVPFMVQVVEGSGENAAHVVGGTVESISDVRRLLQDRWRIKFDRPAQTVVATMTGDPLRHDFESLSRAALSAARIVEPGGRIILLTRANPALGEAGDTIRGTDNVGQAIRRVKEGQPTEHAAALQWLEAAKHASLYLLSDLPDETVEELFATPLQHARQAQRLLDTAESCLFLNDAHKALAVVG